MNCPHLIACFAAASWFAVSSAPAAQPAELIRKQQQVFHAAVDRIAPSVVRIQPIGGLDQVDGRIVPAGPTTGVIVSAEGHIVSSAYGVVQSPSSIVVTLADGSRATAAKVATDHSRKIVLFKIDAAGPLPVAEAVPREEIRTGQWALAVGRAATADTVSRSVGIISAVNRMHGRAVQTDAKVSPLNYGGPLVDLSGRVFGILVPMSPQGDSELAGDEWYDSGIGFAIPLADIEQRLGELKSGQDLDRGSVGVSLKSTSPHTARPVILAVHPGSPAAEAGLQKGDVIGAIDGVDVSTITELRFELVPHYAGDTVEIRYERNNTDSIATVTLVAELPDFRPGFLGLLLTRHATPNAASTANQEGEEQEEKQTGGVPIRHVYDGSPAAVAGIVARDRLLRIDETEVDTRDEALVAMMAVTAGQKVTLAWLHDGESISTDVESTASPAEPPQQAAFESLPKGTFTGDQPETGEVEFELTEFPHECRGYVPSSYRPDTPAAVLLWLHAAVDVDLVRLIEDYKPLCEQFGIILVAPRSENDRVWDATEAEYVAKLLREVATQYEIDPARVVLGGQGAGGVLAFRLAEALPAQIRAVVAVQAASPRTMEPLAASPARRLDVLFAVAERARSTVRIKQLAEEMQKGGVPVAILEFEDPHAALPATSRAFIARWIDALDRL